LKNRLAAKVLPSRMEIMVVLSLFMAQLRAMAMVFKMASVLPTSRVNPILCRQRLDFLQQVMATVRADRRTASAARMVEQGSGLAIDLVQEHPGVVVHAANIPFLIIFMSGNCIAA
jgi:type II secretory pathway component PulJ